MHFAGPPRKTSHPPPFAIQTPSRLRFLRRTKAQTVALVGLGVFAAFYILSKLFSSGSDVIPYGTPPVVIVTVFEPSRGREYNDRIKQNRIDYAQKHGYATFFPNTTDYKLGDSPKTWAKVPALRHAMTVYPHSTYFWFLQSSALVMNHELDLESHIMEKAKLESLMITDLSVVPPDSVIHTFAGLKGDRIDLVLTQDKEGLSQGSMIVRRGEWAKYFLDAWFDPLYRSYNFQKAEAHALEHIVQWHGTILAKLAIIPQRHLNSYAIDETGTNTGGIYLDGDFVANFIGCDKPKRDCRKEMEPFYEKLRLKKEKGG